MTINLAEQCNFTFLKLFYISAGNIFFTTFLSFTREVISNNNNLIMHRYGKIFCFDECYAVHTFVQ